MLARHPLLEGIVDYAGLFPPAALPMRAAVTEYAVHRSGDASWMLAAFVIPAARLDEFAAAVAALDAPPPGPLPLSLLLGADPLADLDRAAGFESEHPGLVKIDAVEFRPAQAQAVAAVAARLPGRAQLFCEVSWEGEVSAMLAAVRAVGAFAKLRTGAVTADLIPPLPAVARFLRACRTAGVGMKFTAGLHHPVRAPYPLTYEPGAPVGTMHGFLNVFCAAALLFAHDAAEATLLAVLSETDPHAFRLGADGSLGWRAHELDAAMLRDVRARFARSFGSCSFSEPVHDLQELRRT